MEDAVEEIDIGKNAVIFQLFSCLHTDTIRELMDADAVHASSGVDSLCKCSNVALIVKRR